MTTALLFDRDRVAEIDDWARGLPRIGRSAVLWIDLEGPGDDELETLGARLGLAEETKRALGGSSIRPSLADHVEYLHVTASGVDDPERRQTAKIHCLVAESWLVTIRDAPIPVVERFREVAMGSGDVGRLDGPGLLANILEWALGSYFDAFERLEQDLEEIDARAMAGKLAATDDVVASLVDMRREVGRLRRALVAHREVVLALTRPELEAIGDAAAAERFADLRLRLEDAVQASRDVRESIVGSFDVVIATTGQRTNEVMKVLTLASVLLLPGALVAGILGMNFSLPIFENDAYFWVVLAAIAAFAAATLVAARLRRWI